MKNYGYKKSIVKPESHVFGSGNSAPFPIVNPNGDWSNHLVIKEFQNLNGIEPYACVIFTILNCVEILIKYQYGIERNYSDRFLAAIVDTRGGGCMPDTACEFLRKIGVPPQEVWPFNETINTSDKFFEKAPQKVMDIAKEFTEEWDFRHKFVNSNHEDISRALTCSPLLFSVYAWIDKNGIYYRPEGKRDIHATTMFYERPNVFRRMFDSYDLPAIKDYRWSDLPDEVKVFYVKKKEKKVNLWQRFLGEIMRFKFFRRNN